VTGQLTSPRLSPREREIAMLIARGLTNKEIGSRLTISERTVGTHVQNIFNKLDVGNRAQIATWWTTVSQAASPAAIIVIPASPVPQVSGSSAPARARVATLVILSLAVALLSTSADHSATDRTQVGPEQVGALVFDAKLAGDGGDFGLRYVIGDPSASAIRFRPGAVTFAVLKPDGNTGNNVAVAPMRRYYTELDLTVEPGSNVEFWLDLDSNGYVTHIGDHLVDFETAAELMQLQYLVQDEGGHPLGPQITVKSMQDGRIFRLAAVADPPLYQVYLDGRLVISLRHAPSAFALSPSFAIFGQGGTVVLTAMRIYRIRE
jgi:DNA-binding CsgD family transcriptional regulator